MVALEKYRLKYAYAEDYGTAFFKYGPVGEEPYIIPHCGYFVDRTSPIAKIYGLEKDVIVGPEVFEYLGTREDAVRNLIYPMYDGIIPREDKRRWRVVYEVTKYGLEDSFNKLKAKGVDLGDFEGFYVVAAISISAGDYMYEKLREIHQKIDEETNLVKALAIIPQPLAVAIAEGKVSCIVVESGHGNTQVCPISRYPIMEAIISINRGGAEADAITAEILRDLGYSDYANDVNLVRLVKEELGLIPRDLDEAIAKAKQDKERFRAVFRRKDLRIEIDFGDKSWMRFLIGEIVFNPDHEIFQSYYKRGLRLRDSRVGDEIIPGTTSLADVITMSYDKLMYQARMSILEKGGIILSGGNFQWKVPHELSDVAVNAAVKVKEDLKRRRDFEINVSLVRDPQYSVWKGSIVYALAVPDDYEWNPDVKEGWFKWRR